nr:hypothetical protein [Tanacetum cinerariifolium]
MGLLDFVKSSDPSKIKTGERTLASGERKVGVSAVPPPVKKARTGGVSINEPAATNAGKVLCRHPKAHYSERSGPCGFRGCTCPPPGRYFVLSSSSAETDIISSQVVPPVPSVVAVK